MPSEHPTDPAPAPSSPVHLAIPPTALMPRPGPDPNSWADQQLQTLVAAMEESKRARADADKHLAANSELVLGHVRTLQTAVDSFGQNLLQLKSDVGSGFTRVDKELAVLGEELLQIKARVTELEAKLAALPKANG